MVNITYHYYVFVKSGFDDSLIYIYIYIKIVCECFTVIVCVFMRTLSHFNEDISTNHIVSHSTQNN